jgi:predicted  nucleic acid-binding Zn-ribbon protein
MDANLTTLLEIQDLKSQVRELRTDPAAGLLQQEQFNIDVEQALATLEAKVTELAEGLDPRVRRRFERMRAGMERVVVPVIEGVCYGCFTSIATASAGEEEPNKALRTCENCGRFIYILP